MKRFIGSTGLAVFPIGLGAMPLSTSGRPDPEHGTAVIHAALDAGVTLIDTANVYCVDDADIGHNERLIADALRSRSGRDDLVVATKGGLTRPEGRWERDGRPEKIRAACERSLRDLNVEAITLYQLHAPDERVPFADSVGALARLKAEGKIRHVGLSNVTRDQLDAALGIVPVASVQNRCNLFDQLDLDNGLIDYCGRKGVAYVPYSPVGGGNGHVRLENHAAATKVARSHSASVYAVALAWLLSLGNHVIPIPGASRVASILDSVRAVDLELTAVEIGILRDPASG